MKCGYLLLFLFVLFFNCSNKNIRTTSSQEKINKEVSTCNSFDNDLKVDLLVLINRIREKKGLLPLSEDKKLLEASQLHINRIIQTKKMVHFYEKKSLMERLHQIGVNKTIIGENLARVKNQKNLAENILQNWTNKEIEKKNLENSSFFKIGIAYNRIENECYISILLTN